MNSIDPNRNPAPADSGSLARIERTFANLVNLVRARTDRSDQLKRQARVRQSRSEAFKQMQREKWLGSRSTGKNAQPPIKDLHKRILLDPNAVTRGSSHASTDR